MSRTKIKNGDGSSHYPLRHVRFDNHPHQHRLNHPREQHAVRHCSRHSAQLAQDKKSYNATGYFGVRFITNKQGILNKIPYYRSFITTKNKKEITIGKHATIKEAAMAYDTAILAAALKSGELITSKLNFPNGYYAENAADNSRKKPEPVPELPKEPPRDRNSELCEPFHVFLSYARYVQRFF